MLCNLLAFEIASYRPNKTQTVVICTEPGAGEGAIGACGGIGSRESAWIEAHDAKGRGCGLSVVVLERLIIDTSRSWSRNMERCRGRLRVLSARNCFGSKATNPTASGRDGIFSAGATRAPSRINYRRYVSPSLLLYHHLSSLPTT